MRDLKDLLKEAVGKHSEDDDAAYKAFFAKKLKKYGVKSVEDLDDDKKKKFFDEIDKEWKADHEKDDKKGEDSEE